MSNATDTYPPKMQDIIEMFQDALGDEKLEILLDFSRELPALPPHLQGRSADMEQVDECQSPFFLASEVNNDAMTFYYDVPMESPTIRGFASILAQGLDGASPQEIIELPPNFYVDMGLSEVMSPLRLRGMQAVLNRMKRHASQYINGGEKIA